MPHLPSSYGAEGTKAEDRKWEKEIPTERYIRKPTWRRRRHLLFPLCVRPTCVSVYLYLSIDLFSRRFIVCPHYLGNVVVSPPPIFTPPSSSSSFSRGRGFTRLHTGDSSNPAPFCQQRDTVLTPATEIGYFGEERKRRINQGRREKKRRERIERRGPYSVSHMCERGGGISILAADAAFRVQQQLGGKARI